MIARHAESIDAHSTCGYPEPFRSRVLPRERRRLGHAFGLTRFGVNLTTLGPGKQSSMRHWHSHEDEFVYVLEGELTLITDLGEEILGPGMTAGFKAGAPNAHQFVNRGEIPARYLEVGNNEPEDDQVHYADVDLAIARDADGADVYVHKDGSPY